MGTNVLQYIFVLSAIVGTISAIGKWRTRRRQMRTIRQISPPEMTQDDD